MTTKVRNTTDRDLRERIADAAIEEALRLLPEITEVVEVTVTQARYLNSRWFVEVNALRSDDGIRVAKRHYLSGWGNRDRVELRPDTDEDPFRGLA